MFIISNRKSRKSLALISTGALILSFVIARTNVQAIGNITISPASTGGAVLSMNGGTTLHTFSPTLDLSITDNVQASATSSAIAYYGVRILNTGSTTGDVHWRTTVDNASALSASDISITEKGFFDADSGEVADSPYTVSQVSGNLVFTGNSGWQVAENDDFTNVDQITFATSSPAGVYHITRDLIEGTSTVLATYNFNVNLEASLDTTAPGAPVINFPTGPVSTTTNSITIGGTAEASSTIHVSGGVGTSTSTTSGSGNWSALVNLSSGTHTLSVTATDEAGNTSAASTLGVTLNSTSTPPASAPNLTLAGANPLPLRFCNQNNSFSFVEPGFTATSSNGTVISATSSGAEEITHLGNFTITYTAVDANGTTTATRTVNVDPCAGSTSGGGGFVGGGRSSFNPSATAVAQVGANIPFPAQISNPVFALSTQGQVLGIATFRFPRQLKKGSRGNDVAELQARLKSLGFFKVNVTGYFGNITAAAVSAFQASVGLPRVGQVGPRTLEILNNS